MRQDYSLTYEPETVISIVSPSRAGSTVIKHALAMHPDVCSLAGEEEPYYKMACNGYPWHASDAFHAVNQPELVKTYIANEIHNYEQPYNRAWLQALHIEEPPFVGLPLCIDAKPTLILKTPQNCYRRGALELLYPKANLLYVRVRRDPRAIVNGLIDGWETEGLFAARYIPAQRIWWKFDMPPGWGEYLDKSIEDRSIFQMRAAQEHLDHYYPDAIDISYEHFCNNWHDEIAALWKKLGLSDWYPDPAVELPVLMATDAPHPERWRSKRPHLEKLV